MALYFKKDVNIFQRIFVMCCEQLLMGGAQRLACAWPAVPRKPSTCPRDRNVISRFLPYLEKKKEDLMKI